MPKHKRCYRTDKVIFDELNAKIALATRYRQDKGEIRYYRCEFCKKFHLTSMEKKAVRRVA